MSSRALSVIAWSQVCATALTTALVARPALAQSAAVAGGRIAYASHRDGNWEIYVMRADGSAQTRITHNDVQDRFPIWSPDGKRMLFGAQRGSGWELWVMDADGSSQRRLATSLAAKAARGWSPDGARIVFVKGIDRRSAIYTIHQRSGGGRRTGVVPGRFTHRVLVGARWQP